MSFICWLFCSFHLKSTKKKIKKIRKLQLSINQDYDAPISQITNTIIGSVVSPLVLKGSQINTKVSKIKEQLPFQCTAKSLAHILVIFVLVKGKGECFADPMTQGTGISTDSHSG